MKYYSLNPILKKDCIYNIIIGERSNGKSFACLEHILKRYCKDRKQGAIIRRYRDDFIGKRGASMFNAIVDAGLVKKYSRGVWTDIYYYSMRWYLCRYEEDDKGKQARIVDDKPFCYGFSLASMEHDKSTSYPDIVNILFDEFLSRTAYLQDEFVIFMNVLSTIIRQRDDVKIFMCGNTVNKFSPYFTEMGIRHIDKMQQGTIDIYSYGNSKLKVAVEYCAPLNKAGKASDNYFAFDNAKLQMITGGSWELDLYPHCPTKIRPKDVVFTYFIKFSEQILQCDIVLQDTMYFTFIHRKTSELKDPDKDIVYQLDEDARPNYYKSINKPVDKLSKRITEHFAKYKVFYQDNEVGEVVKNYLNESSTIRR